MVFSKRGPSRRDSWMCGLLDELFTFGPLDHLKHSVRVMGVTRHIHPLKVHHVDVADLH